MLDEFGFGYPNRQENIIEKQVVVVNLLDKLFDEWTISKGL